MIKTLIRLIAVLVASCLIADLASAAAVTPVEIPNQKCRSHLFQISQFNDETMSVPGLAFNSFHRPVMERHRVKTSFTKLLNGYNLLLQAPRFRWNPLPALRHE